MRPTLRVLPNGRAASWGLDAIDSRWMLVLGEGEIETIVIDLSTWLESGDAIDTATTSDVSGVTVDATIVGDTVEIEASEVTTCGEAALTVTTDNGRAKRIPLGFRAPALVPVADCYRYVGCWC